MLIDEIDKADPSLPNTLLEVLGNGGFEVPGVDLIDGKAAVGAQSHVEQGTQAAETPSSASSIGYPPPLVIITSNDERELPAAFVRRCLVLHLRVEEERLEDWLKERVRVHKNLDEQQCSDEILKMAAEQLQKDREVADRQGLPKPGLAEYLDLITALVEMVPDDMQGEQRAQCQRELLQEIAQFSLSKVRP